MQSIVLPTPRGPTTKTGKWSGRDNNRSKIRSSPSLPVKRGMKLGKGFSMRRYRHHVLFAGGLFLRVSYEGRSAATGLETRCNLTSPPEHKQCEPCSMPQLSLVRHWRVRVRICPNFLLEIEFR